MKFCAPSTSNFMVDSLHISVLSGVFIFTSGALFTLISNVAVLLHPLLSFPSTVNWVLSREAFVLKVSFFCSESLFQM